MGQAAVGNCDLLNSDMRLQLLCYTSKAEQVFYSRSSRSSSSSRNEYYLGGTIALLLQDTVQCQQNQFLATSTW